MASLGNKYYLLCRAALRTAALDVRTRVLVNRRYRSSRRASADRVLERRARVAGAGKLMFTLHTGYYHGGTRRCQP